MSVTSKLSFARSTAMQPATNLWGPMGASAIATTNGAPPGTQPAPSSTTAAMSPGVGGGGGITFLQAVLGIAAIWLVWWLLTLVLEKLLPMKDVPEFFRDWLHGLKFALLVAGWFLVWKLTAGVAPLNQVEPYHTVAVAL